MRNGVATQNNILGVGVIVKEKQNYKCMWAGSLCGLSAGLKNQRMKVRHLPGPPIKYALVVELVDAWDLKSHDL